MEEPISPEEIASQTASLLGIKNHRFTIDPNTETLFIELDGLQHLSEREVEEKAGAYLDGLDSEFDEIVLIPM